MARGVLHVPERLAIARKSGVTTIEADSGMEKHFIGVRPTRNAGVSRLSSN